MPIRFIDQADQEYGSQEYQQLSIPELREKNLH